MEEWRDVMGYENLYKVSNYGKVISLARNRMNGKPYKSKILKPIIRNGYEVVSLTKNRVVKGYKVHRLVAQAFIPNRENKPCVDHIDANRTNNKVENLRWVTYLENSYNPLSLFSQRQALRKSLCRKVAQYDKEYKLLRVFPSLICAEKYTRVSSSSISGCCRKRAKSAGGYIWKYIEN